MYVTEKYYGSAPFVKTVQEQKKMETNISEGLDACMFGAWHCKMLVSYHLTIVSQRRPCHEPQ
jgi:hypothetical protein